MIDFQAIMNHLSKEYLVQDINIENAKIIFILESPHVQEIKFGVPVAGASGATMSRNLFGDEVEPLGKLIKSNKGNNLNVGKIGLMNVCQIPMQRSAYKDYDIAELEGFFDFLEGIRTNQKVTYKDDEWNTLQFEIIELFKKRIEKLKGKPYTFVPCGRFAQKFFHIIMNDNDDANWTIIDDVPHPSYNSWSRERYQPIISQVKQALFN